MTAQQGVPCRGFKGLGQGIERHISERMRRPEGQRNPQGSPSLQRERHSVAHCILQKHPHCFAASPSLAYHPA